MRFSGLLGLEDNIGVHCRVPPVSYTHLDVYKRQGYTIAIRVSPRKAYKNVSFKIQFRRHLARSRVRVSPLILGTLSERSALFSFGSHREDPGRQRRLTS